MRRAARSTFIKTALAGFEDEVRSFGVFPSYFLGLVGPDGTWESTTGVAAD